MPIPDQNSYPPIPELAKKLSPMLSNLPLGHQAWLHPAQKYIWMHDLGPAVCQIFGIDMPEAQMNRFKLLQDVRFLEDCSGRSTGKTHNYLAALAVRSLCMNLWRQIWLGQEAEIGKEVFDLYFGTWISQVDEFKTFCSTTANSNKPKVTKRTSGAVLLLHNGTDVKSLAPDPNKDFKKMQTWRFNDGILNEWTSWPKAQDIPNTIEPIFSKGSLEYRITMDFRIAMEKALGVPLGRLTNADIAKRYSSWKDYKPREHILKAVPVDSQTAVRGFKQYFATCFGFPYDFGVDHPELKFKAIKNKKDIVNYFANYDEGDMAYSNKLVYDGSAKRPSDNCFWLHEYVRKKIEAGDQLYGQYSIGIEDIPPEYAGIIYDPAVIAKFRENSLTEDYKRVYGGIWTEGRAKNPFAWHEVIGACQLGYYGQTKRENFEEQFFGGIDSAQGTDKTYTSKEGEVKDGRGDDGCVHVWKLGGGTKEDPHRLCLAHIAEDIRHEPMAYDIQKVDEKFGAEGFAGCELYMMDPGGGGKGVLERLEKSHLEKIVDDELFAIDVTPMALWNKEDPGQARQCIVLFSLSDEMIQEAYVDKTGKSLLKAQDMLNNHMVRIFQNALKEGTVVLPENLNEIEVAQLWKAGQIDDEQFENLIHLHTTINQLVHLRYETDNQGNKKKTGNGVFKYDSPGKKDAAWTMLMGHMMCDLILKLKKIVADSQGNEDPEYYPVIG